MHRSVLRLLAPALLLTPAVGRAQSVADQPLQSPVPTLAPAADPASQVRSPSASAASPTPTSAGPVVETQSVALKARLSPAPTPRVPRGNTANNRALMIVGGVGLLVGAVIGGDAGTIVMLGSAGVGLLGLYRFLN